MLYFEKRKNKLLGFFNFFVHSWEIPSIDQFPMEKGLVLKFYIDVSASGKEIGLKIVKFLQLLWVFLTGAGWG